MIVNVEILEFPEGGERRRRAVYRSARLPRRLWYRRRDYHPQAPSPHEFPPEAVEQARRIPHGIARGRPGRPPRFPDLSTSSPLTAKPPAISTTRSGLNACPTGTSRCRCTSPTSATTCSPARPSIRRRSARHQRLLPRPRGADAARGALHRICSLRPQEDRLVLSALLEIDSQGDVVAQDFYTRRHPQRRTHDVHERPSRARRRRGASRALRAFVGRFELMRELALILNRKRMKRGSIDFDMPEPLSSSTEFGI